MSSTSEPRQGPGASPIPPLKRGDHIRAGWPRTPHHDGVYVGSGYVIHLSGAPGQGKAGARVQVGTLTDFAAGRPVTVRRYAGEHDPDAIIERAVSRLGQGGYNLVFNNCQHFARWCVTGHHRSEQIEAVACSAGAAVTPAAAAAAGISMVGSTGLVAGLSGPGIMSGLAACGTLIGGGAVAGLVLLGALPGTASVAIMTYALREDKNLPNAERAARTAGRLGAATGAVAASAGTIGAVSSLGVTGLSAVGISSGLAALGAIFGGGMARGVMCAIAFPAIAAAIMGYAFYKLTLPITADPGSAAQAEPPAPGA